MSLRHTATTQRFKTFFGIFSAPRRGSREVLCGRSHRQYWLAANTSNRRSELCVNKPYAGNMTGQSRVCNYKKSTSSLRKSSRARPACQYMAPDPVWLNGDLEMRRHRSRSAARRGVCEVLDMGSGCLVCQTRPLDSPNPAKDL